MTLVPKLPPGRANRKALQFAVDIQRLRSAGYTFSAIRMALLDAGISVSLSTVKREAARIGRPAMRVHPSGPAHLSPRAATPTTVPKQTASAAVPPVPTGSSGREIAEAFFNANPSNPLLRAKESP